MLLTCDQCVPVTGVSWPVMRGLSIPMSQTQCGEILDLIVALYGVERNAPGLAAATDRSFSGR